MSALATRLEARPADFQALFDEVARHGEFRLVRCTKYSVGWYAALELPTPDGLTVKIESNFRHATAMSALVQLSGRLDDLRRQLEGLK